MVNYSFKNYNHPAVPTNGMGFVLNAGWKNNLATGRSFTFGEAGVDFVQKLDYEGRWAIASILKGHIIGNNNFEFYQGATLGGEGSLRSYRRERFLGRSSFFQSTDLRWQAGQIRRSILPMSYGFLLGFDYGRVWMDNEASKKWHSSYGGAFWLNVSELVTGRVGLFTGADGLRASAGLGFAV